MPIPRTKPHAGPHILSYGFRPFFLLGSIFAAGAVAVWLPMWRGEIALATAFAPRDWHVHEMLYGFVPAIVTGFLLTAIPNWTGRLPLQGWPLLALVLAWTAGRMAIGASAFLDWRIAAAIDLLFPLLVAAAAAREVIAGRNWSNLRVVALVLLLFVGNAVFHIEAYVTGAADYGVRLGMSAIALLVALIGGRIIPSFTRNWLARLNPGRLPKPFSRFDATTLVASALALAAWTGLPQSPVTALLLALAAILNAVRLARWAGDRAWRDRLVLVLHVAYGFLPPGLALLAASAMDAVPVSAGVHVLMIGCVALMIMAVMSRASLGHTGRALRASPLVQAIYALIVLSVFARTAAVFLPEASAALLNAAAAAWVAAFGGFAIAYWRVLTGPRAER